jgi:hypothetical protein
MALAIATARDEDGGQALPAATAAEEPVVHAYRDKARSAIREVLARREYADLQSDPYASTRAFLEWLAGLFQRVGDVLKRMPQWVLWTVFAWMVLALVAILAHLIYTLVMLLRGTSSPLRGNFKRGRIPGELLGIKDLDFDTVLAEARRLLAAGDWPAATRYFYVAAILWLDRQGLIVFKRSKTNGDYIGELALRSPIQDDFRRLTAEFEPIVYGGAAPTSSTIHDIATTVESLLHEPAGARSR